MSELDAYWETSLRLVDAKEGWMWLEKEHEEQEGDAVPNNSGHSSMMISDDGTSLTTRHARHCERWMPEMPSLMSFQGTLKVLDLHDCRYITELHPSVTQLGQLESLRLNRCLLLEHLPADLGRLKALRQVRAQETNPDRLTVVHTLTLSHHSIVFCLLLLVGGD
jgi:hypothetical protein